MAIYLTDSFAFMQCMSMSISWVSKAMFTLYWIVKQNVAETDPVRYSSNRNKCSVELQLSHLQDHRNCSESSVPGVNGGPFWYSFCNAFFTIRRYSVNIAKVIRYESTSLKVKASFNRLWTWITLRLITSFWKRGSFIVPYLKLQVTFSLFTCHRKSTNLRPLLYIFVIKLLESRLSVARARHTDGFPWKIEPMRSFKHWKILLIWC